MSEDTKISTNEKMIDEVIDEIKEVRRIKEEGFRSAELTDTQAERLKDITALLNCLDVRLLQFPVLCVDLIARYVASGNLSHAALYECLEILKIADEVRGL